MLSREVGTAVMEGVPLTIRTDVSGDDRSASSCPLMLDREAALLRSDPLLESVLVYLRANPSRLLRVIWWLSKGRAHLVNELAAVQSLAPVAPSSRSSDEAAHIRSSSMRAEASSQFRESVKALRPHQWVKNLLVFVPIVLAGRFGDLSAVASTILAFFAIGIIASATYLINDMWDLVDDRAHWSKRHRPLASGRLLISRAAMIAPVAILIGLLTGLMASLQVVAFLILYLVVTFAYTFGLKRILLIDGLVLAALYTIRVALGTVAARVEPSAWLLLFSMFFFASLTYAKRYTEIARIVSRNGDLISGRGYHAVDAPLVLAIGFLTGLGAVVAICFYIIHDALAQTFYGNPMALWGLPPLLVVPIARIWLKSYRGEMDDDPIHFVLTDRVCMGFTALMLACFAFAWLGPNWS